MRMLVLKPSLLWPLEYRPRVFSSSCGGKPTTSPRSLIRPGWVLLLSGKIIFPPQLTPLLPKTNADLFTLGNQLRNLLRILLVSSDSFSSGGFALSFSISCKAYPISSSVSETLPQPEGTPMPRGPLGCPPNNPPLYIFIQWPHGVLRPPPSRGPTEIFSNMLVVRMVLD